MTKLLRPGTPAAERSRKNPSPCLYVGNITVHSNSAVVEPKRTHPDPQPRRDPKESLIVSKTMNSYLGALCCYGKIPKTGYFIQENGVFAQFCRPKSMVLTSSNL